MAAGRRQPVLNLSVAKKDIFGSVFFPHYSSLFKGFILKGLATLWNRKKTSNQ
jgi:hypothetical protein